MYDYFFSCLCKSYCYFSIPRNVQGPLYSFEDCRIQHSTLYRKEIANVETPQDEQSEFEPDLAKNGEIVSNASPVKSPDEVTEESEPSEISTEKSPESPNKLATLERVYTRAEMDQICQQVISRNQLFTLPFDCSILERRPNILYSVHGTLKNIVPVIAKSAIAESQVVYCPITTEALPTNGCEIDSNEQSFPRNEEQLLEEKSSEKLTIQPLQSYESVDSEKPDQINADDDDSIIFALPSEELADLEDKMNEVSLQEKGETANNDCEKGFQKSMGSLSDEDQKEMNSIVAKFSLLAQTMKPHEFHFDFITDDLVGGKVIPYPSCVYSWFKYVIIYRNL